MQEQFDYKEHKEHKNQHMKRDKIKYNKIKQQQKITLC